MVDVAYLGKTRYIADMEGEHGRLFVAAQCYLAGIDEPVFGLLDTAGEWCMMSTNVATDLGYDLSIGGNVRMHTRFGLLTGRLETVPVEFRSADAGSPAGDDTLIRIDATWFISEEWPGPAVIGWKGCLERMRFGVDPGQDMFYFAEL
jgi:hypothetical protein